MTTTPENPPVSLSYDGGSETDREELLRLHHTFLHANDDLDYQELCTVWDSDPDNRHFNTNGHTYRGLADWENIWNFYRPQFRRVGPYSPGRLRITVRGDMACLAADYVKRDKEWVGHSPAHNPPFYRATQVAVRTETGWKVVHAHFSVQDDGPRPDEA